MRVEYAYGIGACFALVAGLLLSLHWRGLITISFGRAAQYTTTDAFPVKIASKKQGKLFFWNKDKCNHEATEFLVSEDVTDTVAHIANKWLALLEEEGLMKKRVTVSHVLIAASGNDIYLSFDRYPFYKESSAREKWLWIEGLLKTLKENGITIPRIHFKVRHELLRDYHLDFSNPWPIKGFIQEEK